MRARRSTRTLRPEPLEYRLALASGFIALEDGVLKIVGTEKQDRINVILQGAQIIATCNRSQVAFDANAVASLKIDALGGNDRVTVAREIALDAYIDGGSGNDRLQGGSGNDELLGGRGRDHLLGGEGNDLLQGDGGNDRLEGQAGDDALLGGEGADKLEGHAGNDVLAGEAGNDSIHGGTGDDALSGAAGRDKLFGDDGLDWLDGGDGDDSLRGGNDDDSLKGGAGKDYLNGEAGVNLLDGDAGKNKFINGTIVDLDAPPPAEFDPLRADLIGSSFAFGQAVYERETVDTQLETFLHIVANGLSFHASYEVLVGGIFVGNLTTDGDGWGELRLSTIADLPGELVLPPDLQIAAGTTIEIGTELSGDFVLS